MTPRIGFLGLGTMGGPMARNLLKAGYALQVWNRTAAKAQPLQALGAKVGKSPAHVAAEVDVVITMVAQPADVEAVVLGPDGVMEGLKPGAVLIDMSTVSPATSRKLAGAVTTKHAEFLDAPVVGSKAPATEGTLVGEILLHSFAKNALKDRACAHCKTSSPSPQATSRRGSMATLL